VKGTSPTSASVTQSPRCTGSAATYASSARTRAVTACRAGSRSAEPTPTSAQRASGYDGCVRPARA